MMKKIFFYLLLATTLISCSAYAKIKILQIKHFSAVKHIAVTLGKKYQNRRVLLAFDIDNTLLTTHQMLGNPVWYRWQMHLLKYRPHSPYLMCHTAKCAQVSSLVFTIDKMQPVESDIPTIIKYLQQHNFKTIILTARSTDFRNATMDELKAHHLCFTQHDLDPQLGYPGTFIPYRFARPTSYMNGIALASGDNKGKVLKRLLQRSPDNIAAIIFVDDTNSNIINVANAFRHSKYQLADCHYTYLASSYAKLNQKEKQSIIRQWLRLKNTINSVFKNN